MDALRWILPVLMAVGASLAIDRRMDARGLTPPRFRPPAGGPAGAAALLRTAGLTVLAFVLWIGVFGPLGLIGRETGPALEGMEIPDLFSLHLIFVAGLVLWYLLGFAGSGVAGSAWRGQLGLRSGRIGRELGIGVVVGVVAWLGVIATLLVVALGVYFVAGEDALPSQPPEIISWVVALPIGVRLALSLSAGVVEETFFRGFLQPRIGIFVSSLLFVLAHLSYDQPFLLIGVALLSVVFALLVRWRQSIWAAIAAHTVFDAIQLLFVIPNAIDLLDEVEGEGATALATSLRTVVGALGL